MPTLLGNPGGRGDIVSERDTVNIHDNSEAINQFMRHSFRSLLAAAILLGSLSTATAQIGIPLPYGANQPSVKWFQILTPHFKIVYHEGLEEAAEEAANIAEAIYPVVTGNLRQEIAGRTPIYLSDLDDIPNALALGNQYVFIWMRGILADGRYGGIRAAGRAKWLRTVITHEFTHIVVDEAASFFNLSGFLPPGVPRWFNEGVARAMEPDGWTSDVDQVLRAATDADDLGYDGGDPLDGTLLYEGGQSLVRYMMDEYGERVIADILHGGRDFFNGYNFGAAVEQATGLTFDRIYDNWEAALQELYLTQLKQGDRIQNVGTPLPIDNLTAISWAVPSPDGSRIAYVGSKRVKNFGVYLGVRGEEDLDRVTREPGLEPNISWHPDGRSLLVSKARYASDRTLTHDIYRLDLDGDLDRITSDQDLTDPVWTPDGREIIAVQSRLGRANLVRIDPANGRLRQLTNFSDDVQIYTPQVSPDGRMVAFSMFDSDGRRVIGTIDLTATDGTPAIRRLVSDTANNRYPLWSPDGSQIAYTSHAGGVPNIRSVDVATGEISQVTTLVDGVYGTGWVPGTNRVIVIAIESPGDITPWLVEVSGGDPSTAPVPKRDAWQDIAFRLTVPAAEDIPAATIEGRGSYNSIDGIHPIVPFFPTLQNDIPLGVDQDNGLPRARIGAFSLWWDPMMKHQLLGFLDYGLASETFGWDVFYVNNSLPISIATHIDWSIGLQGVIPSIGFGDFGYYQKSRGGDVTAALWLPATDALDVFHEFRLRYENTTREPIGIDSAAAARAISLAAERDIGREHTVSSIGVGYTWTTPNLLFEGSFDKAIELGGGDFTWDKLQAHVSARVPVIGPLRIVTTGHAVAQWGDQLPYEFLGLHRYDLLSTDVGVSLRTLTDYTIRVRGVDIWIFGDRAWTAAAGLELGLDWISFLAPYRPGLMVFAETGSAWFDEDTPENAPSTLGYGVELRMPYFENLHFALGLAHGEVEETDLGLELYTRVGWGF